MSNPPATFNPGMDPETFEQFHEQLERFVRERLIPAEAIRPAPEMSSAIDAAYIRGLAQVGERMVVLLDIESMLLPAKDFP